MDGGPERERSSPASGAPLKTIMAVHCRTSPVSRAWIAGEFGKGAHASRDPAERNISIDQVHGTSLDAPFPNLERQGGILIPAGMIKMICYWD